jgi:hypothetical protein
MITPPKGKSGTSSNPITVKALTDGGPQIDGQSVRVPVFLLDNDYFVLEGFDAKNGYNEAVVRLATGADNNTIRRVCGWDVMPIDANSSVFANNGNTGNVFEDICFFGIARKGFETSQGGNNVRVRRAFGIWERNSRSGPKLTFAAAYNSRNIIMENVIGGWQEVGSAVEKYGNLGMDGITDGKGVCVNSKYLGSVSYVLESYVATGWLGGLFGSRSVDCFEFRDVISYVDGSHTNLRPIFAQNYDGGGNPPVAGNPPTVSPGNRKFTNITEIGGASSSIHSTWTVTNRVDASAVANAPNVWNGAGTSGARICYRYVNGTLTNTPLWPWPMDARIRQALSRRGTSPDIVFGGAGFSVTMMMEKIFGTIPPVCRS